jgi:predicted glycosyltransferase
VKVVFYCQHVLGIGHFFRTHEICEKLKDHDVILVSGGDRPDIPLPGHVRELRLPGLMMDENFKNMFSKEKGEHIDAVKEKRQKMLFRLFEETSPDVFMIELYPFGRKAFRFEIDPILEGIRDSSLRPCRVVCSLRDVLVEKENAASYEERVVKLLNRCFDTVFVHSDPGVLKLDATFSRLDDISIPIVYTGFVTPKPVPGSGQDLRTKLGIGDNDYFVVASAGGGKVGGEVLAAVVKAFAYLPRDCRLQVFTGPFLDDGSFFDLKSFEGPFIRVDRFTPDFLSFLDAADLSVSMAGYNTSMNIMAAGIPALVWPFAQNREQRLRAERLARLGGLQILSDKDLDPERLAGLMTRMLTEKERPASAIDLNGAEKTAAWMAEIQGRRA